MSQDIYIVFSRGKTLSDGMIDEVAYALTELFDLSQSEIRKQFLNGEFKKIKSTRSHKKAERLMQQAENLGLACKLHKTTSIISSQGSELLGHMGSDPMLPIFDIPSAPNERGIWFKRALLTFLLAAGAGFSLLNILRLL